MRKNTLVVFFLLIILILSACNSVDEIQPAESVEALTNQGENQPEERKDDASTEQSDDRADKAQILKVNTDLEVKDGWHIVPKGITTLTISVEVENVDTILFWIAETGTGTWGERQLIGYDIDGSDGWSITWEFGERKFHDHISVQVLGSDFATQASETINIHSVDETVGD